MKIGLGRTAFAHPAGRNVILALMAAAMAQPAACGNWWPDCEMENSRAAEWYMTELAPRLSAVLAANWHIRSTGR